MILIKTKHKDELTLYVVKYVRQNGKKKRKIYKCLGKYDLADPYFIEEAAIKEAKEKIEYYKSLLDDRFELEVTKQFLNISPIFIMPIFRTLGLEDIFDHLKTKYDLDFKLSSVIASICISKILTISTATYHNVLSKNYFGLKNVKEREFSTAYEVILNEIDFIQQELYQNTLKVFNVGKNFRVYRHKKIFLNDNYERADVTTMVYTDENKFPLFTKISSKFDQITPVSGSKLYQTFEDLNLFEIAKKSYCDPTKTVKKLYSFDLRTKGVSPRKNFYANTIINHICLLILEALEHLSNNEYNRNKIIDLFKNCGVVMHCKDQYIPLFKEHALMDIFEKTYDIDLHKDIYTLKDLKIYVDKKSFRKFYK